jgi:outer membrane protein OmpA-like peptidoglycan-associated protein
MTRPFISVAFSLAVLMSCSDSETPSVDPIPSGSGPSSTIASDLEDDEPHADVGNGDAADLEVESGIVSPVQEPDWRGARLSHTVNTQLDEYLPVIDADKGFLYFTGMDRTGFFDFKLNITEQSNSGGEDLWLSTIGSLGAEDARPIASINTRGHEAITDCLPDGSLLVTANYPENMSPKGVSAGVETTDLFHLIPTKEGWRIRHLPEPANSMFTEADATYFAEDGVLLFVSDRPGHVGEYNKKGWKWNGSYWGNTDVWMAEYDPLSMRIRNLRRLPEPVNTAGAERSPWLSPDGLELYLSSNGPSGKGPLKVVRFSRSDRSDWTQWSQPEDVIIEGVSDGDVWGFRLENEQTAWCAASFPLGFTRSAITGGGDAGSFRETNFRGGYTVEGRQVASIDASREFDILRLVRSGQPDVILEDVLFETGSAELAAAASEAMDWLADRCLVNEGSVVSLQGHADNRGGAEMNLDLSLRRAESLAAALKSRGVRNPIEVEAFGESAPKQSNADARGRRANRRVEVYFLFSGQT